MTKLEKERLLLLCKTYPDVSQKYYYRICMAGITEQDELRRIFPIPLNYFLKNVDVFRKYHWIEYELKEKGDSRKESFKIKYNTIKMIRKASTPEIFEHINKRISSLEELNELKSNENISLGFIKPKITDIKIELTEERKRKKKELNSQLTLFNNTAGDFYIPYLLRINFICSDSSVCSGHSIICEDIIFWNFFKEELKNKNPFDTIEDHFKKKFLTWMQTDNNLIFMVGTHFQFKTWLIISIIHPQYEN